MSKEKNFRGKPSHRGKRTENREKYWKKGKS